MDRHVLLIVTYNRVSLLRECMEAAKAQTLPYDRILVIDGGKVAEEGSYEELIAKNGLFAELVSRQQLDNGC